MGGDRLPQAEAGARASDAVSRAPSPVLSVAPMMDWTDRHYRRMMRRITRRTLLYTEMVTTNALLYGDAERLLAFHPDELPLVLQLGGDDPADLATCARMAADVGFSEVNLNVGCPSDRVQRGRFGACLMGDPARVAEGVAAMREAVPLPVTVKHRIGIDDRDAYGDLLDFVDTVAAAGADRFTVHARKAWLSGLSPKQNREVPPLRYGDVHRLKTERPRLTIEINGGIRDLDAALAQLTQVDAVMIGRAAFETPMALAGADARLFGAEAAPPSLREVLAGLRPVVDEELAAGTRLRDLVRPMVGLLRAVPGARIWRRILSEGAGDPAADASLLDRAREALPAAVLDARPGGTEEGRDRRDYPAAAPSAQALTSSPTRTPSATAAFPSRTPISTRPNEPR